MMRGGMLSKRGWVRFASAEGFPFVDLQLRKCPCPYWKVVQRRCEGWTSKYIMGQRHLIRFFIEFEHLPPLSNFL